MSSASTSDINKTPSHHGRALTKEAKRLNSIRGTQRFTKPSQTNGYDKTITPVLQSGNVLGEDGLYHPNPVC